MPKMKTHRGAAKRFKLTGTGKIRRRKAFRDHLLELETASIDQIRRERPVHEGVIEIGAVSETNPHKAPKVAAWAGRPAPEPACQDGRLASHTLRL